MARLSGGVERRPSKIISGGQTGVDRAALDVATELGLARGGWCPRGRRAEKGRIPERYPLQETPSVDYAERTEWNVRDADATLIITRGALASGTALTAELARRQRKPFLIIDLAAAPAPETARQWLARTAPRILNVAGPRESGCPGIYEESVRFLRELLGGSKGRS